jgi:hypothetical protein
VDWAGETLRLSIDPSRDQSLYNFRHRASLIALGSMIENMTIAAREYGFAASVEYSSSGDSPLPFASVTVRAATLEPDALFPSIARRCTNRKPYASAPIAADARDALARAIPPDGAAEFRIIEDARQRRLVARAASLNDRLLFEIRTLHDRFFETIRWTNREAEITRDGLFIKTLELGPLAAAFKALRSWNFVRATNVLGASMTAPLHSFRTFMRSSAFGFLQMEDASPHAFIQGGRLLQRLWLTATRVGLAFQPMAGTLYLLPYLRLDGGNVLGGRQRSILLKGEALLRQVLPLDDGKAPIMLFRVGYGPPPTAGSLRRPLEKYSVRPPWSQ